MIRLILPQGHPTFLAGWPLFFTFLRQSWDSGWLMIYKKNTYISPVWLYADPPRPTPPRSDQPEELRLTTWARMIQTQVSIPCRKREACDWLKATSLAKTPRNHYDQTNEEIQRQWYWFLLSSVGWSLFSIISLHRGDFDAEQRAIGYIKKNPSLHISSKSTLDNRSGVD